MLSILLNLNLKLRAKISFSLLLILLGDRLRINQFQGREYIHFEAKNIHFLWAFDWE